MTKRDRAVELRDLALGVVKARGTMQPPSDGRPSVLAFSKEGLTVFYRTPFQKLPEGNTNLPYGLDIWHAGKVLNIEWADHGRVDVISYKRGPWERELEALAEKSAER